MAAPDKKKQLPLRLSPTLYAQLSRWAEEDFRSLNGQIEFLLTQAVNRRYGGAKKGAADADSAEDES